MLSQEQDLSVLEQKLFLHGFQRFEIQSDGNIEITTGRISVTHRFKIPLWQIIPSPERILHKRTGDLIGFIFFGLLTTLLLLPLFLSKNSQWGPALILPAALVGILSVECFRGWKGKSYNVLTFHTRYEGRLNVWFEKPNAEVFHSFCKTLTKKAEEAWANRPIDPSQYSLAGEITALKKLKDEGILSETEFEKAKAKLLEQVEQKRIGFA